MQTMKILPNLKALQDFMQYEREVIHLATAYNSSTKKVMKKVGEMVKGDTITPLQACRKLWSEWKWEENND